MNTIVVRLTSFYFPKVYFCFASFPDYFHHLNPLLLPYFPLFANFYYHHFFILKLCFLTSSHLFFSSFVLFLSLPPGLPVLIVTITLASASGKYSADGYCWLSVQNGVIWGFAGPVIFIIMVSKLNHNLVV